MDMLESDRVYHEISPRDLRWGKWREKPITVIQVHKTVYDGEQMSVAVPIFESDDRETMKKRVLMFECLFQERMEDFNRAMLEAEERYKQEKEAQKLKPVK